MSASVLEKKKPPDFPELLRDGEAFRDAFERGLVELLRTTGEIGEDILVLCNANFEPRIWGHLRDELLEVFGRLARELAAADREGKALHAAPDDIATLRAVLAHGLETLQPTQSRCLGPWELQFNPLRTFRPARHSHARIDSLHAPFDAARFHFDKPFLTREILWQGPLLGRDAAFFYNKFPFADYQCMLVPDLKLHRPQYLETADLEYLWMLGQELGGRMPGFSLAYNSYGAHASVNHLHFHTCLRDTPLPIEDMRWKHNGGTAAYPCRCLKFTELDAASNCIAALHADNVSYNLVLTGGALYCLPRRRQGEVAYPDWLRAVAWYEMSGGFPLAGESEYENLSPDAIAAALASENLPEA